MLKSRLPGVLVPTGILLSSGLQKTFLTAMKYFYALVLLAWIGPVSAQDASPAKAERLSHFYVAPSVGFEFIHIKDYTSELANNYSVSYKGTTSLRMGLDVTYKQTKNFLINAGVFISQKNFKRTEIRRELEITHYESQFKSTYYEVLGGATYNFMIGRLDLGVYTNLNFAFLNKAKEIRETENGNSFTFNVKDAQNQVLTVIEPGININYNITYRLSFNLRTGYRAYTHSFSSAKIYSNSGLLVQPGLFYMF